VNQPPSLTPDRQRTDEDHLNLLAIFHFVGAGFAILGIGFLGFHYMMFRAFMENPQMWQGQRQDMPPQAFFAMFKVFYLVFGMWFVLSAILNAISGFSLRARRNRTFSLVVAAFDCLYVPFGTVLGVFTIVILQRDSVRNSYRD